MGVLAFLKGLWDGAGGVIERQERAREARAGACMYPGAVDGRIRHWYKGDAVCRRCGRPNPYLKNASIKEENA